MRQLGKNKRQAIKIFENNKRQLGKNKRQLKRQAPNSLAKITASFATISANLSFSFCYIAFGLQFCQSVVLFVMFLVKTKNT